MMRARCEGRGRRDISRPRGVTAPVVGERAESCRRCMIARARARRGGIINRGKVPRFSTPCDFSIRTSWERSHRRISGSVSAVRV